MRLPQTDMRQSQTDMGLMKRQLVRQPRLIPPLTRYLGLFKSDLQMGILPVPQNGPLIDSPKASFSNAFQQRLTTSSV